MSYNATEVRDWIPHDPSEADRIELSNLLEQAESGDAAAIAERCGIARPEADLVVALAKSQEH